MAIKLIKMNLLARHYRLVVFLLISFAAGFYSNAYLERNYGATGLDGIRPIRQQNVDYKYINPLLSYDFPPNTDLTEFKNLNQKIKILISENLAEGKINRLGVYFKDFKSGQWTGINENGLFQPASLLKIPVMIAYFKLAETDSRVLDKYLTIIPTQVTSLTRAPSGLYKVGQQYQTSELIRGMIVESDNAATDTLIQSISPSFLSGVFSDLGIKPPTSDVESQLISPKIYGLFFRVLYNATYLNKQFSEKALMLMDQVTFKDGIDTDHFKDIPVADKFGERIMQGSDNTQTIDFHDCGIIYYPLKPYLLCIMTEGKQEVALKQTIQDISNLTLDEVKK